LLFDFSIYLPRNQLSRNHAPKQLVDEPLPQAVPV
jgi:hypothetical protein